MTQSLQLQHNHNNSRANGGMQVLRGAERAAIRKTIDTKVLAMIFQQ